MSVWATILLVAVGVPGVAAMSIFSLRAVRSAKARVDGDAFEAEEMLVAFGATKEWV